MNKTNKILTIILIVAIVLTLAVPAVATSTRQATLTYRDIKITLDGKEIRPTTADGNYVEPFVIDGTTYLPIRGIASALGLGVDWESKTSTVILKSKDYIGPNATVDAGTDLAGRMSAKSYSMVNSIGDTYYCLAVTNNSQYTVEIQSNAIAKDTSGTIIGAATASEHAVGAGETICLFHYFDDIDNPSTKFEYTLSVSQEKYYKATNDDLSIQKSISGRKVIILATNNGNSPAKYVEATAIFLKGGKMVGHDDSYIVDIDDEIKPRATLSKELSSYEDFDDVLVFVHGRANK